MDGQSAELRGSFGFLKADQILDDPEALAIHAKSTLPVQRYPRLLLHPESAEEVRKILLKAAELQLPVWYVSTGKNWGYGCKSAPYSGGITMVLERMNRILEVDVELGYAVIEPGVTYKQLNDHLSGQGLALWTDSAGTTQSASVIGNALDKGRGLTPYADHFNSLCGMEVVLADGSVLETAPTRNFHCKHTYKWGLGPYIDGLFTQSNFGVVVKAGVLLMPQPEDFDFFAFEYTAPPESFGRFIDDFRTLFFSQGILSRPHLANDFAMLCIVDRYPDGLLEPGRTHLTPSALAGWKAKHGIRDWTFGGGLYGTKKQIAAQKELVKRHLGSYGTIRFIGAGVKDTLLGRIFRKLVILGARWDGKSEDFIRQIFPAIDLFRGKPTDDFAKQVYFKSKTGRPQGAFEPARDGCGFIWTGPLVPFTSGHISKVLGLAKDEFERSGFDFFVELIVESPRTIIALFGVFFDPASEKERERAESWYQSLRQTMNQAGYTAYRETSASTPTAMDGNPELKQFLSRIKSSLDPQCVLAPGRYGIGRSE